MPHTKVPAKNRGRAKQLRRAMTKVETLLWHQLKAHRLGGFGFRRQMPFREYILDFVSLSAKLVIEIDGPSHDFEAVQKHDLRRDAVLKSQGFKTLRFSNDDVLSNLQGVVEAIRMAAASEAVPPSLSLPHKGGGDDKPAASGKSPRCREKPSESSQ